MKKSFEEILRKKTNDFNLEPKVNLWQSIEEELRPQKKKRIIGFYIIATLVLFSLGVVLYQYFYYSQNQNDKISQIDTDTNLKENKALVENEFTRDDISQFKQLKVDVARTVISSSNINEPIKNAQREKAENKTLLIFENSELITEKLNIGNEIDKMGIRERPAEEIKPENKSLKDKISLNTELVELGDSLKKTDSLIVEETLKIVKRDTQVQIKTVVKNARKSNKLCANYFDIYGNYSISNSLISGNNENAQNAKKFDKSIQTGGLGFNFGIAYNRHKLYTGLNYFTYGYNRNYINVTESTVSANDTSQKKYLVLPDASNAPTSTLTNVSFTLINTSVINKYSYFSIPIGYSYQFFQKQNFGLDFTSVFNLTLASKSHGVVYNSGTNSYESISKQTYKSNSFGINTGLGIDIHYSFYKNFNLMFKPQLGFSFFKVDKSPIESCHRFLNIGVGLRYILKN
jgi:hypothetical protein